MIQIPSYIVGTAVDLVTTLRVGGVPTDAIGAVTLELVDPLGDITNPAVTPEGSGVYSATALADKAGHWWYRWLAAGQAADEGEFDAYSHFLPAPPPNLNDIRVLIPRVQRAVEGVVQSKWELVEDEVKDLVADACADLVLYTGSVFGSALNVTARDPVRGSPTEYSTDQPLSPQQAGAVAAQAALMYFYHRFAGVKISEQISDEASHWEYALSPTLLIAQLKLLQDARDKALEAISAQGSLEVYMSWLAVRDTTTSRAIEPWVYGHPEGYGLNAGGLEGDFRFDLLPSGGGDYSGGP